MIKAKEREEDEVGRFGALQQWQVSCGEVSKTLGGKTGWSWGAGGASGPLVLTLIPVEALVDGTCLMSGLTGIEVMSFVLVLGQREGAAQAVGAVFAVLLRQTVQDTILSFTAINLPLDIDVTGVEVVQEAHD